MTANVPPNVAFSLVCAYCDVGMEIGTYDEAIEHGWTYISYVPECPMANFIGLCPDCRRSDESEILACGA